MKQAVSTVIHYIIPTIHSLPAEITNTTSPTVFRNRLKTFVFHQTPLTAQLTSPAVKHLSTFGLYGAI